MNAIENFIVLVLTTEPMSTSGEEKHESSMTFLGDKVIYINHNQHGYFHGVWFTIYYSNP